MKYDELRNQLSCKISPWQLKLIVQALNAYAHDSPQAAFYPEEFWTFVRKLRGELSSCEFLDSTIEAPNDRGMLGPMPKIK